MYAVSSFDQIQFFKTYFPKLTCFPEPYCWQEDLFLELVTGKWPTDVCLPTGMGKTSVIAIWFLAMLQERMQESVVPSIPRRLIWVVNRRVVVDQASDDASKIAERVAEIPELSAPLNGMSVLGGLAVGTLRGELADTGDWRRDPSRPAVVVGTVDMIGSRLLFRGYGDGKYYRPQHAGLLGRDAAIINDEAHLTPAFASLLEGVAKMQGSPAFRYMRLSATPRGNTEQWPSTVQRDAESRAAFKDRFRAAKRLFLHPVPKRDLEREVLRLATAEGEAHRVLIFVQQPEKAKSFASQLEKQYGRERVALLTGTMRGRERDLLANSDPAFRVFLQTERPPERHFLVSTAAGEVGVNLTSDLLITDLDTADHLLQRFGRLNRFGEGAGTARLVYGAPVDAKEAQKLRTLEYFQTLPGSASEGYDISCAALYENPAPREALSEEPALAHLDDRLVDLWSQTSVGRCAAVPPVDDWLHGARDPDGPDTQIVWREDVKLLANRRVNQEELESALDRYPVRARERLKEPSRIAREKLAALDTKTQVVLIDRDGEAGIYPLEELLETEGAIEYGTLLLPPGCGYLSRGMFDTEGPQHAAYDVADELAPGETERRRYQARKEDGGWVITRLATDEVDARVERLDDFVKGAGMKEVARVIVGDDEELGAENGETCILYLRKRAEKNPTSDVTLKDHTAAVAALAREMARKAGCSDMVEAFATAGKLHDTGKAEPIWQAAAGRKPEEEPLAKPRRPFAPARLSGFRHEFASLRDAETPEAEDLVLHLIASHHGWSRPYFPPRAYDRRALRASEATAQACIQRFGRLQKRYGPWGLAYMEAIFKAADGLVSRREQEEPEYA